MKKEFKNKKSLAGIRIEVSKRDIRLGTPGEIFVCPLARATRRTLGLKATDAVCVASTVGIYRTPVSLEEDYELPKRANKFVLAFDEGKPIKPFSFKLGRKLR